MSPESRPSLVIWGAGGHAMTVADIVRQEGVLEVAGFLDSVNPARKGEAFAGGTVLGGEEALPSLRDAGITRILIGVGDNAARARLAAKARAAGFTLGTAVHPGARIAGGVAIGPGSVVMAGAVVNPGTRIGENVVVNTGATVDHECILEDGSHLSPGVHLGGGVHVGRGSWIGIGASVKDKVRIGAGTVVGAGAVVLEDLPDGVVAYGVPARAAGKSPSHARAVDFTVVIPVYFNEGTVQPTMRAVAEEVIAKTSPLRAEVIFVDDGSGDRSLEKLLEIRREHPGLVRVIKLSRNFGQVSALFAGFAHARGRCVVAMSADGQDPPELIRDMLRAHYEEGYEVVVYTREGRDESRYRILTSRIFYALMRRLSFPNMPAGGFDFVLIGRKALDVLLRNQETHPFFQGQILWLGFRTKFVGYRRRQREAGRSRWTFAKKLTYLIDGVLSYSFFPIRAMSVLGIAFALIGFLYAVVVFVTRLFFQTPMKGWAPLMIVVLVMGGFQMLMLGTIGEYVWRTLAQVRHRDPYVIETIYEDAG